MPKFCCQDAPTVRSPFLSWLKEQPPPATSAATEQKLDSHHYHSSPANSFYFYQLQNGHEQSHVFSVLASHMLTQASLWLPVTCSCAIRIIHVTLLCLLDGGETDKISLVNHMLVLTSQKVSFSESKLLSQDTKKESPSYTKFDMMLGSGRLSSHVGNL